MRKCILFCLMLLFGIGMNAQNRIKGRVLDGALPGEPLAGASIKVPGSNAGAISDMEGNFLLDMPEGKNIIQVSMMGYKTQVVNVRGKVVMEITLQEDQKALDEVVVVGYGTMKKRDLTGAVAQIKSEDIMRGGQVDVAHAVQGKIAGVQVNQNDGAPGAGVSITVRGANSTTTNTQPLYIVDGIPYETGTMPASGANEYTSQTNNPLASINPHDIEKIEVLKDASATAIYGSRGANGVVIITTKKGQAGKAKVEFNAGFSVQKIGRRVEMLGAGDYARFINEGIQNAITYNGAKASVAYDGHYDAQVGRYFGTPEDYDSGARTVVDKDGVERELATSNWQDEIYQVGTQQDYSVSVSGGSDKGYYSFSGGYTKQVGIIKNTGYERYNLGLNISRHLAKWLEVGTSAYFTHQATDFQRTNSSENTGIIRSALLFPPTYGVTMNTAQLDMLNWLAANPVSYINGARDELKGISFFSSIYAEAKITSWLKFRQNVGIGYNDNHRSTFYDQYTFEGKNPTMGKAGKAANIWKSITSESLLTFDKGFGIHRLNAVAGVTFEKGIWDNSNTTATNYPSFATVATNIGFNLDKPVISSDQGNQTLESFLARVNYSLLDKYLFTASVRADGSSKFVTGNKWATFLSGAFAWRASDEEFVKNWDVFSNLKFRLSYGETGNQGIGSYRTVTLLDAASYAYDRGRLESGVSTIDWRGPTNPDLKWETTGQFNAGIDFGFMDNALQFTVDYYYKKTRDLLQNVSLPFSSGYSNMLINSGNVTNEGLEMSINYNIFRKTPVKWSISGNISFNRNKMSGLSGDQYSTALWSKADQVFLQRNGCPMGTLYGYVEDGFFDNVAEVRSLKQYANLSDAEALKMVGEIKYRDYNGDGYITAEDRRIIGDTNPDFIYGFTSDVSWKGLTLSFMMQGSQGNDIFNANLYDIKLLKTSNITRDAWLGRWTPQTASTATYPKALDADSRTWPISNRFVEDGSYVKMKYLTVSYDWMKPAKFIEKIRVAFTVNNVFTITKYSWFDPDVNAFASDASRRGVDSYSYPSARSYTLNLNVVF